MACAEWTGLINCCRERLRNALFSATIWLKTQHFYLYLCGYMRAPACPARICITEGHSFPCTCALWQLCLFKPVQTNEMVIHEDRLNLRTRAYMPTSQHAMRMHSLLSLISNLKQARRSLSFRDRERTFRLRMAIFGLFLVLSRQPATQWISNFDASVRPFGALMR
jgi:hypothetical protein